MGLKVKISFILLMAILSLSPARANAATVSDLSKQFICQCGCNMVLLNCSHDECVVRDTMTAVIKQKLAQGQSEEQITQFLVAQYGEQVLAAPTKKGFNLTAWITPFAAILAGGGAIYIALKKWVKRGGHYQTEAVAGVAEEDEEYQHRLEEELEDFADRGFR